MYSELPMSKLCELSFPGNILVETQKKTVQVSEFAKELLSADFLSHVLLVAVGL